jgi:hypothetical protein
MGFDRASNLHGRQNKATAAGQPHDRTSAGCALPISVLITIPRLRGDGLRRGRRRQEAKPREPEMPVVKATG